MVMDIWSRFSLVASRSCEGPSKEPTPSPWLLMSRPLHFWSGVTSEDELLRTGGGVGPMGSSVHVSVNKCDV